MTEKCAAASPLNCAEICGGKCESRAELVRRVAERLHSLKFYRACGARPECVKADGCATCFSSEASAIVDLVLGKGRGEK